MLLVNLEQMYELSNKALFENILLPEGLSKQALVQHLLDEHGEYDCVKSDIVAFKRMTENFFRIHFVDFERMLTALTTEYEPLHNYDRKSIITDESKLSAFDSDDYEKNSFLEHTDYTSGNIGVTTSQQLLNSEVDLRTKSNIYKIIGKMFLDECLVSVYGGF